MTHITVVFLYSPTIPLWYSVSWTVPLKVKVLGQTVGGGGGGGGGGSACIEGVCTHIIIIIIIIIITIIVQLRTGLKKTNK